MRLVLLGYGFVGKAVHDVLKDHHNTIIVDPKHSNDTVEDQVGSDGYIICLPTPQGSSGECDMSIIFEMLNKIPIVDGRPTNVLIKSTISIEGWREIENKWDHLDICFSPEFLTAANAVEDFKNQKKMLFGGGDEEFWINVFKTCKEFEAVLSSIPELILTKYVRNSFLAAKVAFFNEIYDLCSSMNIQYDEVSYLVGMDERIGYSHLKVPGPDGDRGFGGACFPKDTNALNKSAIGKNCSLSILEAVIKSNTEKREL
jgi:UDPglucose 6-dehydrogenase|tara:strand:- start:490 stop:1263 length:774 start_codon:yes stop_codon:yes gene_type:complete